MFARFVLLAWAAAGALAATWHDPEGVEAAGEELLAGAVTAFRGTTRDETTTATRSLVADRSRDLATSIVLDFEGVGDNTPVGAYYNGTGGPDYGVVFSSYAWGVVDWDAGGSAYLANMPSPNTALWFTSPYTSEAFVSYSDGFTALSFYYSAVWALNVTVYAGPNGTGIALATFPLPEMGSRIDAYREACNLAGTCRLGDYYVVWDLVTVPFTGVAKSFRITAEDPGVLLYAYIDDVTIIPASYSNTIPTASPTKRPTASPTKRPTTSPTKRPTASPTKRPTKAPTKSPSKPPSTRPTRVPTKFPTAAPTRPPSPTLATSIILDFEGVCDDCSVKDFYNGDEGPNYGVVFGTSANAFVDEDENGNGEIANEPSPSTVLWFFGLSDTTMTVASGFTSLSFYYSSDADLSITVHTGPSGAGAMLANVSIPRTGICGVDFPACGDPTGKYGKWILLSVPFTGGVARSVRFVGDSGSFRRAFFDDMNITLVSSLPATRPPTKPPTKSPTKPCAKTTYWLWNPTTNKLLRELTNNSASCISLPYNIEVRPCAAPSKLPVVLTLWNATSGAVVKTQKESVAPFFLWGDKKSTGDVFPSTKPLRKGAYFLTSSTLGGGKVEKIKFTKTC